MTSTRRAGSTRENPFSTRLSQALADSGLSLARVQKHLAARGRNVSVATLSYWSNGHSLPARANSLDAVADLESVLGLPSGHLLDALLQTPSLQMEWDANRQRRVREAIEAAELPSSVGQSLTMAHLELTIDEHRCEATQLQTLAVEGRSGDLQGWSSVLDLDVDRPVHVEALEGARVGRHLHIEDTIHVIEFLFDPPLAPRENRLVRHLTTFGAGGAETHEVAYALQRQVTLLVLSVHFQCEPPTKVDYTHTPPGDDSTQQVVRELAPAPTVSLVVPNPTSGLHTLHWTW